VREPDANFRERDANFREPGGGRLQGARFHKNLIRKGFR
jgi:hypothetical protein